MLIPVMMNVLTRDQPKPEASCICNEVYNPDDDSMMHFCPRSTCRKSFHSSCLQKAHWTGLRRSQSPRKRRRTTEEMEGEAPRSIQLQRSLPLSKIDDIRKHSSDDIPFKLKSPPSSDEIDLLNSPRKRGRPSTAEFIAVKLEANDESAFHDAKHRQELLPSSLLRLAQSPMVKGEKTSLPRDTGVVAGNIAFVMRAREIVNSFLVDKADLPEDWEEKLQLPNARGNANVEAWIASDEDLVCPSCGGPI